MMNSQQKARLERLAIRVNDAKNPAAEAKARDAMDRYQEQLMDAGIAPEAIIEFVHG